MRPLQLVPFLLLVPVAVAQSTCPAGTHDVTIHVLRGEVATLECYDGFSKKGELRVDSSLPQDNNPSVHC